MQALKLGIFYFILPQYLKMLLRKKYLGMSKNISKFNFFSNNLFKRVNLKRLSNLNPLTWKALFFKDTIFFIHTMTSQNF